MLRHTLYILALACLTATGAQAVHLSDLDGSVLVNNKKVAANTTVAPGDRVKVLSGSVKIVYDNGAIVHVAPGQTAVVLRHAPHGPAGSLGGAGPVPDPLVGGDSAYLAAGAVLGGAIGLTATLADDRNDHDGFFGGNGGGDNTADPKSP